MMTQRSSLSMLLGAGFVLATVVLPGGAQQPTVPLAPKTPRHELLPAPPHSVAKMPPLLNEDLQLVAEVIYGEPVSRNQAREQALKQTKQIIARINHLNQIKRDGFLETLLGQRTDLQGLPFQMGDACRLNEAQARLLPFVSARLNESLQSVKFGGMSIDQFFETLTELQARPALVTSKGKKIAIGRDNEENYYRVLVSTMMQVLGPETEKFRVRLARSLASIPHVEATRALANLALFAPEQEVRATAIQGLKLRREKDYTDILLAGFQYPLPEVSRRAAAAVVKLDRQDLAADLVGVLEQRDPRLPAVKQVAGKQVAVVRELVKVNHHHNCLLCHAPGNTPDVPNWTLAVPLTLTTDPLPSQGGYEGLQQRQPGTEPSRDIFVRIDMTYLRQDFSLTMPVARANPWPLMQRFDFFVRTRVLTDKETQAWQARAQKDAGKLSPYQQAALMGLRGLTGRDAEATPQAWRDLLKPTTSVK